MIPSVFTLIPPLLVFITAFITKKVLIALSIGILSGAFIISDGNLVKTVSLLFSYTKGQITNTDTLMIMIFLSALGSLIALISYSGGALAYGNIIRKKIHDKRSAQLWSMGLSLCFFFDDFFSSITTGCIMRPLTDHFYIPRVKLAFLIDSMAAPLAILIPFSSWIAMLMMQLEKAGIGKSSNTTLLIVGEPFIIYLQTIPFIFYSFIIAASTLFIVYYSLSFGNMRIHEDIASQTGNLFGGKEKGSIELPLAHQGNLYDFFVPLISLIGSIIVCLLFLGNASIIGGSNSLYIAFTTAPIFKALAVGSSIALGLSLGFFMYRTKINYKAFNHIWLEGIKPMGNIMLILISAWIFSDVIHDLQSGDALATLIFKNSPLPFLPAFCFIGAAITSIFIGSSWGTIAIMTPLVVPILLDLSHATLPTTPENLPMLFPLLGATFAGAVAGDHISPLSSTTIMSSTSSGAYHFDHIRTQFEYALPVLIATTLAYGVCGMLTQRYGPWYALGISLPLGITISFLILYTLSKKSSSRD